MARPKSLTIKAKQVTLNEESKTEEVSTKIISTNTQNQSTKVDNHITDNDIHVDKHFKDILSTSVKNMDNHINNESIHVTLDDRDRWNNKETPSGAQAKVNKLKDTLELHKNDTNVHITKLEKENFKNKYTREETRNLLKHGLTGLKFLPSINTRSELNNISNPEFNSCVYVRSEKITLIFNSTDWVEFNGILNPEVTSDTDGMMKKEDKIKLDSIEENANNYIHPDNVDVRHVSDAEKSYWNEKADSTLVSRTSDGLMSSIDKIKLDSIEENANNYIHPDKHGPSIIEQDENNRFVSDEEKTYWNKKAEVEFVNDTIAKTLSASKSFTNERISSLLNSTEEQLQVLRSLSFDLKKDDVVKQFFDLYNQCTKSEEFKEHITNSNIHLTKNDKILLNNIKSFIDKGLNPDWNETDQSSPKYIENKPTSLKADGGNADTVGGYTAEELLTNKSFYDYTIGTSEYNNGQVSVRLVEDDTKEKIKQIINNLNKGLGHNILFKSGMYTIDDELVIRASNITLSGIGSISKLLGVSIRIIGNYNTIENINISNKSDVIENKTAIYIEGNNNIIRNNIIMNYNDGIIVEGSNNEVYRNTLVNIRNSSIKLTSEFNGNYGNTLIDNTCKNSNIGINIISSKNQLYRNNISKNKVFNCDIGIVLSNTISDSSKTINNIISENFVIRGRGESSEYLPQHKTIVSEFSSKNIISSNITSGKEVIAPNNIINNNIY